MTSNTEFIDQDTAADFAGVSVKTIRRFIADGRIPAYRLGKRVIRIRRSDLEALFVPIEPNEAVSE